MIYLIAKEKSGEVVCPAGVIDNHHIPERRYSIVDHVVMLDGHPEPVLNHDWLTLASMPDGQYRPMAPSEQNALRKRQERKRTVEE